MMKKMSIKMLVSVLLVFGMAGIVNAYVVSDDFNSYADGTALSATTNWYSSGGGSPVVNGGTVSPSVDIATMSGGPMQAANKVKWTELKVGDSISLSMDFQAANNGTFNDDRLGMMNDFDSTTSDRIFGAQLEGHHIESYFNRYNSNDGDRIELAGGFTLTADAWYTFYVTITKLGDYQMLLDTRLTTVGGDLVGSGSLDTSTLEPSEQPNWYYFTDDQTSDPLDGGLWPAFKNYNASTGAADNFSFEIIADSRMASNPNPKNNDTNVLVDLGEISWKPGEFVEAQNGTHNVFFGTDETSVTNATIAEPLGTTLYQGLDVNSVALDRLEYGTTYYWRVDEVNIPSKPGTVTGLIWNFTTELEGYPLEPAQIVNITASENPVYPDEQEPNMTCNESGLDVNDLHSTELATMWLGMADEPGQVWIQYEFDKVYKLHDMLVWNYNETPPGETYGAKDVNIAYSLDGQTWTALGDTVTFNQATGDETCTANTVVYFDGAAAKFVKLTFWSSYEDGLYTGGVSEVRFSAIPTRAAKPDPEDEDTGIAVDAVLGWKAGRDAVEHNLYIGTDVNAVTEGTASMTVLQEASYAPVLDLAKTYYWKVDEVNMAEAYTTWDGDVWSFSTVQAIVVDNFEVGYDDTDANAVWATWIDGFGNESVNGALMGNEFPGPYLSTTNYNGGHSAPIRYNNTTASYSEVKAQSEELPIGTVDWTIGSPMTLTIWFRGDVNTVDVDDELYCKIGGKTATNTNAINLLNRNKWYQWDIDLASLGANISNIPQITIGIKKVGATGGKGILFIDYIRLTGFEAQSALESIFIEAESGAPTEPFKIVDDAARSGGQYINTDNGSGNSTAVPPTPAGTATYTFEVSGGVYRVELLMDSIDAGGQWGNDSLWISFPQATNISPGTNPDNPSWIMMNNVAPGTGFEWDVLHSSNHGDQAVSVTLPAGTNTMQIAYREDGLCFDAIEITKISD